MHVPSCVAPCLMHQEIVLTENDANCIRCGLCLAVCPTYREALSETASPRGRVVLARKGLEGELEPNSNLIEQTNALCSYMYACFDCMACNDVCPVGVHPADLALEMRSMQERHHPAAWKNNLFGGLIARPGRMELATWPLRLYQRLGLRRVMYALNIMGDGKSRGLLPRRLRDMEAMLPHLPQRPLRQVLPRVTESRGASRWRVGFFLGCAQSLLFASQSAATVRVLSRNGCTVIAPKEIVCCGMPARGYGRDDLVAEQARRNIAVFEQEKVDFVITDCATCGSMLKEYGDLLASDPAWGERAAAFSQKVRDISEFLGDEEKIALEKPQGRLEARVTYHDPCHLRRGQGVWQEPRALLGKVNGLELVELPEADWCCGSAGSQLITHYDTSLKVLQRKMDNITATGAQFIASGCPGCQMQLNVGVRRSGLAVQVVHPVEILDRAYSGSEEKSR